MIVPAVTAILIGLKRSFRTLLVMFAAAIT
jgi:hypothetical protein